MKNERILKPKLKVWPIKSTFSEKQLKKFNTEKFYGTKKYFKGGLSAWMT